MFHVKCVHCDWTFQPCGLSEVDALPVPEVTPNQAKPVRVKGTASVVLGKVLDLATYVQVLVTGSFIQTSLQLGHLLVSIAESPEWKHRLKARNGQGLQV